MGNTITPSSFKVKFTHFSANNCLDLDPSSAITINQNKTIQIIPDNYQSSKTVITPKKSVATGTRTAYTGTIESLKEDSNGAIQSFRAFMNFWAGGDLEVDFETKQVKIRVSGSGVPTVENIIGNIVEENTDA